MREMKDSGVEWIGKIPKDWEIVPLTKQLDSIVDYRGKTPEKTEEGTFLVTAKNIKDGKICYELSKEYVREADYEEIMHRGIPQIGDILFTTEAPLGQVANVDRTDIALAQRIIKFRALSTVNNYYLKYWMLNEGFQQFLHSLSTGSTATGIKSSKLKASDVDNFTIYALKDEIIDGEEEISDELADKKKQDIHAKIYLRRKYSDVDLYLGSMNASYSAINKNVEMMLWLGTKNMYLNGDKFLEDIFCGPVGDAKNPFEQVTVADAVLETESDNRNLLEQKIKDLCRVKRQAVISEDNENAGKYKIEVEFSGIESDSEVTVSPFNSKQEQTLSEHIEFSELEILQLSEFYEITARSGDDTIRRIIMIPTSGFPDDRESAAVNSVVKDRASFVEYIAFVLGDDYVASMLEGKQMGESGFFANSSDAMPALYEKMLKTSVEGPERIKDIGYVLKMVTDKDIIPDEFRELYETFCNTLKIRR